ncbi:MAG: hypothetical protein ACRBBW_20515 [Cellvibrionaceae bacterium]
MAYIELGDTLFRGHLVGAKGSAKFKLTAGTINAVESANIAGAAVSFNLFSQGTVSASAGGVFASIVFTVVPGDVVEVSVYSNRLSYYSIDGVAKSREGQEENLRYFPVVGMHTLSNGSHTLALVASTAGSATYDISIRYLKETGV